MTDTRQFGEIHSTHQIEDAIERLHGDHRESTHAGNDLPAGCKEG